jgi:hypothetical protein
LYASALEIGLSSIFLHIKRSIFSGKIKVSRKFGDQCVSNYPKLKQTERQLDSMAIIFGFSVGRSARERNMWRNNRLLKARGRRSRSAVRPALYLALQLALLLPLPKE